jgi:hypothetical protein
LLARARRFSEHRSRHDPNHCPLFRTILMSVWSIVTETWRNTPAPLQTIITAAFGTLIGAWLVSRSQAKRRVVDELRAVHTAHALCFSIINRALALKLQQIRPVKERHDEAVAAFHARQRGPLELALDLETISQIKFPEAAPKRSYSISVPSAEGRLCR